MSGQNQKALAKLTAQDVVAAGTDSDAAAKAIEKAMGAAVKAAAGEANRHTFTDGAANLAVSVGSTATVREAQNIIGMFGKRARAVFNKVAAVIGSFGVLATRKGSHAHTACDKVLTVAVIDGTDAVHKALTETFVSGDGAEQPAAESGEVRVRPVN